MRATGPPNGDLLDTLKNEEDKVLHKHWSKGGPTGDGSPYYDKLMGMRMRRLMWKSRIETGGELVWLVGKLCSVLVAFGFAWQHVVH
jgi:hypothetical protein